LKEAKPQYRDIIDYTIRKLQEFEDGYGEYGIDIIEDIFKGF
jgi:hypothetical protein